MTTGLAERLRKHPPVRAVREECLLSRLVLRGLKLFPVSQPENVCEMWIPLKDSRQWPNYLRFRGQK